MPLTPRKVASGQVVDARVCALVYDGLMLLPCVVARATLERVSSDACSAAVGCDMPVRVKKFDLPIPFVKLQKKDETIAALRAENVSLRASCDQNDALIAQKDALIASLLARLG